MADEFKAGDKVEAVWTLGDGMKTVIAGEIDRQDDHGYWIKTDHGIAIRFQAADLRAA